MTTITQDFCYPLGSSQEIIDNELKQATYNLSECMGIQFPNSDLSEFYTEDGYHDGKYKTIMVYRYVRTMGSKAFEIGYHSYISDDNMVQVQLSISHQ